MGRLNILASGLSSGARAQARGKLFEGLVADVLRKLGYDFRFAPNVNYAGMELDIDATHIVTGSRLYGECKAHSHSIDSPSFQAFFGKYSAKWHEDSRVSGLFLALPGLNSAAKGFYQQYCQTNDKISIKVLEEQEVLEITYSASIVCRPAEVAAQISSALGTPGDSWLLYSDRGPFWIQFITPVGKSLAQVIALFDGKGQEVHDRETRDYLTDLQPDLADFPLVSCCLPDRSSAAEAVPDLEDDVVEVQGSSSYFEYQFPASPQFLVGRKTLIYAFEGMIDEVLTRQTSSRSVLFQAYSGWGKSSAVLAVAERLRTQGHFAIAIDSRSASSSRFILRVVDQVLGRLAATAPDVAHLDPDENIGGFDAAAELLIRVGRSFESAGKLIVIFLDQFENLFFLPDALRRIRDLVLRILDAQTNIVFGFSWKTDLVGLTNDFPYSFRDDISSTAKHLQIDRFSVDETAELIKQLEVEIRSPLRKDLAFLLTESSQGYPWLLKKLCAHVKALRQLGATQHDIANNLLNIEELFLQDMSGLTVEQEEALRRIARVSPIGVGELGEDYHHTAVQSLVDRRLVVRIGSKYDIYWDIFKDYLNNGSIPDQENYILRMQVGSVSRVVKLLVDAGSKMSSKDLLNRTGLALHSMHNVIKEMKLLGLVVVRDGNAELRPPLPTADETFEQWFAASVRPRLRRNRLVAVLSEELAAASVLTVEDAARLLSEASPYISAGAQTWRQYARTFADWMDTTGLAAYDSKRGYILLPDPSSHTRSRRVLPSRIPISAQIPRIQYRPIERTLIALVEARDQGTRANLSAVRKSTLDKALKTLEEFEFIHRTSSGVLVLAKGHEFVRHPDRRASLFAASALEMQGFAAFIEVLEAHSGEGLSMAGLAEVVRARLGLHWKSGTAETNVKIMLDWARHLELAPEFYSSNNWSLARSKGRVERRLSRGQRKLDFGPG